jgi:hypothetical protein
MKDLGNQIRIDERAIEGLCREAGVVRLSVFGSVLRPDFSSSSDIDLLVVFDPGISVDLYDICSLQEALTAIFGRPVDLVEERALINPFRRREIMQKAQVLYAA